MKNNILLILFLILLSHTAISQTCEEMIKSAQVSERSGKYFDAYKKYDAALTRCGDLQRADIENKKQNVVMQLERQRERMVLAEVKSGKFFIDLETEKNNALLAKDSAKLAEMKAVKEKEASMRNLMRADSLSKIAQNERKRAESTLNLIYFYQGKYGLAYDGEKNRYGFIDKKTNIVIPFDYEEAKPFDPQGLAWVGKDHIANSRDGRNLAQFLIDTLGNKYRLELRSTKVKKDTKAVDLSYSGLTMIPLKITFQDQLTVLRMNYCRVKKVPKRIGNLWSVKYMQINNNKINKISDGIGKLKNLESLDMSRNSLSTLPKGIGGLMSLKVLNLKENHLEYLPSEIGSLKKLQFIDLSDNKLSNTSLPESVSGLERLEILNVRKNNIRDLPKGIVKLKNLKELDLRDNPISPSAIDQLRLDMPWCVIKH